MHPHSRGQSVSDKYHPSKLHIPSVGSFKCIYAAPFNCYPHAARIIPALTWQVPGHCTSYCHPPHRLLMAYNREAALSGLGSGCDTPGQFLAVVSPALTAAIPTARFLCTATNISTSFTLLSSSLLLRLKNPLCNSQV